MLQLGPHTTMPKSHTPSYSPLAWARPAPCLPRSRDLVCHLTRKRQQDQLKLTLHCSLIKLQVAMSRHAAGHRPSRWPHTWAGLPEDKGAQYSQASLERDWSSTAHMCQTVPPGTPHSPARSSSSFSATAAHNNRRVRPTAAHNKQACPGNTLTRKSIMSASVKSPFAAMPAAEHKEHG